MDNNGDYPLNPLLDIGLDGDVDWEYNGTGYGPLGHQTVFNTDEQKRAVLITAFVPGTFGQRRVG